jgi:hypothetical protein
MQQGKYCDSVYVETVVYRNQGLAVLKTLQCYVYYFDHVLFPFVFRCVIS